MQSLIIVLIGFFLGAGCTVMKKWFTEPDQPPEEIVEQIIENYTGLDIDLTPNSPEEHHANSPKRKQP